MCRVISLKNRYSWKREEKEMEEKRDESFDILNFDQGPTEIIKYMDYLPDNEEERMNFLLGFLGKALGL